MPFPGRKPKYLSLTPFSGPQRQPLGRVVLEFHVIEHLDTHSLAMIATRPVAFEATPQPKAKPRDVQIAAGEILTITLARPLIVHVPRSK